MKLFIAFLMMTGLAAAADKTPVLLELFTSEGCSSCPPADRYLQELDEQPIAGADLIVLSEHVDYWNHLGWRDPFSSAQFTQRQQMYADRLSPEDGVYTPELVIDGHAAAVGGERTKIRQLIEQQAGKAKPVLEFDLEKNGDRARVTVKDLSISGSDTYVAVASDRVASEVHAGENSGRKLTHVAVVYRLDKLPRGGSSEVKLAAGPNRIVVFVQDRKTGQILAAAEKRIG